MSECKGSARMAFGSTEWRSLMAESRRRLHVRVVHCRCCNFSVREMWTGDKVVMWAEICLQCDELGCLEAKQCQWWLGKRAPGVEFDLIVGDSDGQVSPR